MNDSTRRRFLTMAGAGAVVAGAAAVAPSALAATTSAAPGPEQMPDDVSGSLVAYVHDVRKGEITVMVDGSEVVITDRACVAKLAKAASAASSA